MDDSLEIEKVKTGIYRHFKGHLCRVLGMARHSETLEALVVYEHVETGELWVRPVGMFFELISHGGAFVPRFKYTGGEKEEEPGFCEI